MSNLFHTNKVEPCESMIEFVSKIETQFPENIAFIDGDNNISYSVLCENIKKCVSFLQKYEHGYFFINISKAYYYAIAFLSVVCSGHIAVLSSKPIRTDPLGKIVVHEINETLIKNIISNNSPVTNLIATNPNSPSVIVQSSGTTSVAKFVVHSQKALLCNMHSGMSAIKFEDHYRYLHVIPYYHLFGLVSNMLAPLYAGGTICDSGSAMNVYSDFLKYRINATCLPPVLVTGLWKVIEHYGFQNVTGGSLKKIICAGAPPDFSVYDRFEKEGVHIYTGYGLTECAPCVSVNAEYANKVGSCGPPVICNTVKIINGEIAVKGDNLMLGYWESPDDTIKVFSDGWLLTGDLGYLDGDGFLFVTGRKTNLIVFENGEKLIPEQLEQKISSIFSIGECKATEFRSQNKVLFDLQVVSDEEKTAVETQIKEILNDMQLRNRLHDISVSAKPLEKAVLGKVKRD